MIISLIEEHMGSYILRKIDEDLWRRVKSKAALEGTTLKALIERLLAGWLADTPGASSSAVPRSSSDTDRPD